MAGEKRTAAEVVAQQIIDMIHDPEGVPSWRKPWTPPPGPRVPTNASSEKPYRGGNIPGLAFGRFRGDPMVFATFNQWKQLGEDNNLDMVVKKGERSTPIFVPIFKQDKDNLDENGKPKQKLIGTKLAFVFHFSQVQNSEKFFQDKYGAIPAPTWDSETILPVLKEHIGKLVPIHDSISNSAYYIPGKHEIFMPQLGQFANESQYYATLLHETTHATEAMDKAFQDSIEKSKMSKDDKYAYCELRAELGSLLLAQTLGLPMETSNAASYIEGWGLRHFAEKHQDMILRAANYAQNAVDIICTDELLLALQEARNTAIDNKMDMDLSHIHNGLPKIGDIVQYKPASGNIAGTYSGKVVDIHPITSEQDKKLGIKPEEAWVYLEAQVGPEKGTKRLVQVHDDTGTFRHIHESEACGNPIHSIELPKDKTELDAIIETFLEIREKAGEREAARYLMDFALYDTDKAVSIAHELSNQYHSIGNQDFYPIMRSLLDEGIARNRDPRIGDIVRFQPDQGEPFTGKVIASENNQNRFGAWHSAAISEFRYTLESESGEQRQVVLNQEQRGKFSHLSPESFRRAPADVVSAISITPTDLEAGKRYTFTEDPGHGWLVVPVKDIQALGIADQITPYSYLSPKGGKAYLEEDLDAGTFLKAYAKHFGLDEDVLWKNLIVTNQIDREAACRRYDSFSPEKLQADTPAAPEVQPVMQSRFSL